MPKLRVLIKPPPDPQGDAERDVEALRDYLLQVSEELAYLLTHLEADNINDSTFERINGMIPKASVTAPPMDGAGSAGGAATWARGDHHHPENTNKVDKTTKVNGHALSADITLTAGDIGYDGTDSGLLAEDTKGAIDELAGLLFEAPTQDGTYLLQCTVVDGDFEYEWVSA